MSDPRTLEINFPTSAEEERFGRIAAKLGKTPQALAKEILTGFLNIASQPTEQEIINYLKKKEGYYVAYDVIAGDLGIDKDKVWALIDNLQKRGIIRQHPGGHPNYALRTGREIEED